jgi:hypothetical protein
LDEKPFGFEYFVVGARVFVFFWFVLSVGHHGAVHLCRFVEDPPACSDSGWFVLDALVGSSSTTDLGRSVWVSSLKLAGREILEKEEANNGAHTINNAHRMVHSHIEVNFANHKSMPYMV